MITDWDDAYANSAYIPDTNALVEGWWRDAAAYRAASACELDVPYGRGARAKLDLFHPAGSTRGLVVFVHGGYWMDFDKSAWSHLAAGPVARGWAVAIPSYDLCPDARIAQITRQIADAVGEAAARVAGPIALSGHSAGGQLAMRLVCADAPLPAVTADRIRRVVGISGVYDLRPLLRTRMNTTLGLDEAEASSESPALLRPEGDADLTLWVGAAERPEFRRQSALLANIWYGMGMSTQLVEAAGRHHFDVFAPLCEASSDLTRRLCDAVA